MKKQLLLIVMLLSAAASAFAVEVEIDGLWYEVVTKVKEAKVIKYKNNVYYNGDIVIPETVVYEGVTYSVTSIGDYAFLGCSCLTSVIIPNSVTSIGNWAFSECSCLTSVTIPNSVTSIGDGAFSKCFGLTSLTISNSVTSIGDWTFSACSCLTSVTIPNSVTSIGYEAFRLCSGLTSVTIGNSVTNIGNEAFSECSGLTSVTIPNSVTSIGWGAFIGCSGLTSVTIPNSVTSIGDGAFSKCFGLTSLTISNSVTSIGAEAFKKCSGLTSVTIPNSVTSIGGGAFEGCSGLTSVVIGGGVKTINSQAFANCPELADVTCYAENVPSTQSNAFEGSYIEYVTLHVPSVSISSYESAEPWKNFKNIIKIDMPKHTLTYLVDGDLYKTIEIEEGEFIVPEPAPTKEGYTFSGWSEIPETMPAHDVTVTGTFSINMYKLTYTVDGEEYKSYEIEYGATITPEAEPTKEGYTFSGWSEIPETMPAHDVTVTGTFSINKYKLTYVVDGAEYKTYEVEYGATITPEAAPTKEGYTFSGWSEIPETMPAHNVTVTGTFAINKYKLTYVVDGAEYKTYEIEYGTAITPEAEPTKEGYTFSGWSEIPETMPAHDVTITGSFTMSYPYGQCETPTISYANGKLKFECKTEGVEYVSTISDEDIKTHTSDEVILTATYLITAYAKAEGYKNSEVAAATLCWIDAEPWAEGTKEAEDNVTEVKALPVLIQANDGVLNISGTSEGANISVYDTSGRMLGSSTAINGKAKIVMPSINKNIIVKIGDKAVKVKI